jgi:hypothetical protein
VLQFFQFVPDSALLLCCVSGMTLKGAIPGGIELSGLVSLDLELSSQESESLLSLLGIVARSMLFLAILDMVPPFEWR